MMITSDRVYETLMMYGFIPRALTRINVLIDTAAELLCSRPHSRFFINSPNLVSGSDIVVGKWHRRCRRYVTQASAVAGM